MRVAKEILMVEGRDGDFEPAPTKAQRRKAETLEKRRKERWETIGGYLVAGGVGIGYAAIFAVWIFADAIWPVR